MRKSKRGDQRAFADLLARLEPILRSFARRYGPAGHEDDAVQEAGIRIWRKIVGGDVDVRRESTVRQFLCNAGLFAIKTLNTKEHRHNRRFEDREFEKIAGETAASDLPDLPPVVALYFDFIVQHGTMLGAHKAIGRKLKINRGSAFRLFHSQAKELLESL